MGERRKGGDVAGSLLLFSRCFSFFFVSIFFFAVCLFGLNGFVSLSAV